VLSLCAKTLPSQISVCSTLNFCHPAEKSGQSPYVPIAVVSIYTDVRIQQLDSLGYLVSAGEERGRHAEAELLRGFEIEFWLPARRAAHLAWRHGESYRCTPPRAWVQPSS